ncbi:MAG: PAS domain-containing protein [Pseudomonadota bacterium]|nr:PAS domain-containing protein [Pseudomonadota bacterium]
MFDGMGSPDSWRIRDDSVHLRSPWLARALQLWQERRDGDRLPARADFAAEDLMRLGGRVALVEVVDGPPRRYRLRLVGSSITRNAHRDATGRWLDEIYRPDRYPLAISGYESCIAERGPAGARGRLVHVEREFVPFVALDLPLASDGRRIDMILKCVDFV